MCKLIFSFLTKKWSTSAMSQFVLCRTNFFHFFLIVLTFCSASSCVLPGWLVYIKKGQRRTDLFFLEMFDLSYFFKKSKISIQIVNSWFVITKLATTNNCLGKLYALVIRKRTNDYDLLQLPNNKNCMKIWFLHPPALFIGCSRSSSAGN